MRASLVGKRILVIEDEYMVAMLLEDMLTDLKCVVAGIASRPSDAFQLIDTTVVDAAVLDVNLNGVDSFGIAGALRERKIPFVFATGYGGSRLPPEFVGSPILQKPYRLEQLSDALHGLHYSE